MQDVTHLLTMDSQTAPPKDHGGWNLGTPPQLQVIQQTDVEVYWFLSLLRRNNIIPYQLYLL